MILNGKFQYLTNIHVAIIVNPSAYLKELAISINLEKWTSYVNKHKKVLFFAHKNPLKLNFLGEDNCT